ncbi:UDP-N-acetylmuramoyl-L-alanine--D-glutamate ligase [Agromyces aerolatus]|uniref:UDP-N-acetylmuramoyl-L-alanine--D-glutamate ligase n=1 Tax=Agromyces sp. LY-1074 TaxID=3074080 RepID=UPI002863DB0C|nr:MULTISPECIES: UDP-N-acetylmuramoyl-L-alanine--D-glutamate ligase [unclassified Agromyces]MDR5700770.1 UDP-N-acetylmuramoyl-L-alanine--D-glutamate ligase [Agromyces sp. LY-1074]MDR5707291.1 UDP-N-acetylmuramoyl-L-alanine--D-glutamate ligase [Agromyces sp. LY-1358]
MAATVTDASSARLDALTSWHADWKGLRVAVLGLGVTGFAVADTLTELGADVLVLASKPDDERARILDVIGAGFVVDPLETPPPALVDFAPELVIASPGFHPDHAVLEWAAATGIPVWGDIELAWRVRDKVGSADWIVVTGTNGKTTTVQLTATLLAANGLRAAPCGNIGVPVLDAVRDPGGFDVFVVELSSYQLHHLPTEGPGAIHPWASVCLNVADDHLDWHGSFEAYRAAKGKVYANTRVACVYNRADEATRVMVEDAEVEEGARAIGFGLDTPGPSDFGVVEGILCDRAFLEERHTAALEITTLGELEPRGLAAPHIVQNILAASALARSYGVPVGVIHDALLDFRLDAHRIETVAHARGIRWIDDSKATNPHAAQASLTAFGRVVWIVGGLLKGVDADALVAAHVARLRAVVVIGRDRAELVAAFGRHAPGLPLFEVTADDTEQVMPEAVALAAAVAEEGDTVLLAPAAASMDQFADYGDRGRRFHHAVQAMLGGEAGDDTTQGLAPREDA